MMALPLDHHHHREQVLEGLTEKTPARFPDYDAPDAASGTALSVAVLLQRKNAVTGAESRFWSRGQAASLVDSARHT